jgi:hypothetical protein
VRAQWRPNESPETHDEQKAATNLHSDSKSKGQWRQWQTRGTDHFGGRPNCGEFAETTQGERQADHQSANEGNITDGFHGFLLSWDSQ